MEEVIEETPKIPFREDTPRNQKKRLNNLLEQVRGRSSKGGEMVSRRAYLRKVGLKLEDLYKPTDTD